MKVILASEARELRDNVLQGKVTSQNITSEGNDKLAVSLVHFSKGTTRGLDSHSHDQILYITEGRGVIATEKEEVTVTPGTFVFIPAGEKHSHNATKDSALSHIAIRISEG